MTPLSILQSPETLKTTTSRCPACSREISARVVRRGQSVWMEKTCPDHGAFQVQLAADDRYYHLSLGDRSGSACCGSGCGCGPETKDATPALPSTDPFDVLPSCLALIEIVDSCNLSCPACYASSPWGAGEEVDCISTSEFTSRVQGVLDRKGSIDILQLTGGEPTIHPNFLEMLEWSLDQKRIGYVLINTNAVRIAQDEAFRSSLAELRRQKGKFELYVQFDGPQEAGQRELRNADLRAIRQTAIDQVGALGVPSTLAMTVTPTTIAHLGDTLRFAVERPHCRGITFQPMFTSGRVPTVVSNLPVAAYSPKPISVGDVIRAVTEQSAGLLTEADFTPLPCGDPNCHTVGYLLRIAGGTVGLSKLLNLPELQGFLSNRVNYKLEDLLRCGCETETLGTVLKDLELSPDLPFRIFIKPFMDAWTFDQDRIDRCCTHVIRPDGKLDSFCRYYANGGAAAHAIAAT